MPAEILLTHNIEQLVGSLDDGMSEEPRTRLRNAPELVKHEDYITMCRTCGAYGIRNPARTTLSDGLGL